MSALICSSSPIARRYVSPRGLMPATLARLLRLWHGEQPLSSERGAKMGHPMGPKLMPMSELLFEVIQLHLHKLVKRALAFHQPPHVVDDLRHVHGTGLAPQPQAAHQKFLDLHRASAVQIQELEKAPGVRDILGAPKKFDPEMPRSTKCHEINMGNLRDGEKDACIGVLLGERDSVPG